MKNVLKLIGLFLLAITLNSCSKEDQKTTEPTATLIGKWEFSKTVSLNSSSQEVTQDYLHRCATKKNYIEFSENAYNDSFSDSDCVTVNKNSTYTYQNTVVDFKNELLPFRIKILALTATEMKIKYESIVANVAAKAGSDVFILTRK